MTIKKIWQIVCDNCGNTINDYNEFVSLSEMERDEIIQNGNNHFCSQECMDYFNK